MILLSLLLLTSALAEEPTPPAVILHVGDKVHMLENARLGNVPQPAWDRFIMGAQTRYGLVPYRRGLYGGTDLDALELYAHLFIGTSKTPWLMEIHVREECRSPARSSTINTDPRYHRWLATHVMEIFSTANECLSPSPTGCSDLVVGTNALAYGRAENPCDAILGRFLADENISVVLDGAEHSSWYIRDRNCVETIRSSPRDVLRIVSEARWDQRSRQRSFSGTNGGYGMGTFMMLVGALADSETADEATLTRLRERTQQSDIRFSFTEENAQTNPRWVREAGPALVDAYRRCSRTTQLPQFQSTAREFLSSLQTRRAQDQEYLENLRTFTRNLRGLCGA